MLDLINSRRELEDVIEGVPCQHIRQKLVQQTSKTGVDWASSTFVVRESRANTLDAMHGRRHANGMVNVPSVMTPLWPDNHWTRYHVTVAGNQVEDEDTLVGASAGE